MIITGNRRQLAMKIIILLKTKLLRQCDFAGWFRLIATLSYRANYNASLVKIKQVSSLASEGIYYRLSTMLTKPVNISQTMALTPGSFSYPFLLK